MQLSVESLQRIPIITRARPWIAVIGAAIVFALIPLIGLPLFYALPLIGLALAAGSPPDYVADAKPVARRTRNLVLGILILILLAVFVLQPQLNLGWWSCSGWRSPASLSRSLRWLRWPCRWRWPIPLRRSETCRSADWS